MRIKRRELQDTNISFLDVITCAFGAVILLMMITKVALPSLQAPPPDPRRAEISSLQRELFQVRRQLAAATQTAGARRQTLALSEEELQRLKQQLAALSGRYRDAAERAALNAQVAGQLKTAQQQLTAEMERLYAQRLRPQTNTIGGIPIDSEYIIFIIDTSGSMFNYAWPKMIDQVIQTLQVYPTVKGIQVMSDQGAYLFPEFAGRWIPDNPNQRREVVQQLLGFNAFSKSSPVEGIYAAINSFYEPGRKMSLYIFGDEFTGKSIHEVIEYVGRVNKKDAKGNPTVRIHAIGFPTQFANPPSLMTTGIRYATLMRELTHRNGGTFVGLNSFR